MRTMADVMGMPIRVLDSDQACALGAAMFAAVAAGIMGRLPKRSRLCAPVFRPNIVPIWNGMQFMIIFMRVIWNSEQRVE